MAVQRGAVPVLATITSALLLVVAAATAYAAPTISFKIDGSAPATLREQPYAAGGYPRTIRVFEFKLSQTPSEESTMTVTTTPQCMFTLGPSSGAKHGQSYTTDIGPSSGLKLRMGVGAVDDSEYEGSHSCPVSATVNSSDATFNGQRKHQKFTITDNDSQPAAAPRPEQLGAAARATEAEPGLAPGPPSLDVVTIDNTAVARTGFEMALGETVVFSGTTIPNGQVTLTVYPELTAFKTTADERGKYRIVAVGVPLGQHRAEVTVVDPETELSSAPAEVAKFSVIAAEAEPADSEVLSTATSGGDGGGPNWLYIGIGFGVLLAALGAGYWWGHRQRNEPTTEPGESSDPRATVTAAGLDNQTDSRAITVAVNEVNSESWPEATAVEVITDSSAKVNSTT